jgi:hypothetical protein
MTSVLLKKESDNGASKAYHRTYQCNGIHHCIYADPEILSICNSYDRANIEDINKLRQKASKAYCALPISEVIKQNTAR